MADNRWNAGAWFGTLGGASIYVGAIGIEIAVRSQHWVAAGFSFAVFAMILGLGMIFWIQRSRVAPMVAFQAIIWAGAMAGVAAFALREVAGLEDYPLRQIWWLFLMFPALSAQMYIIDRKVQKKRSGEEG